MQLKNIKNITEMQLKKVVQKKTRKFAYKILVTQYNNFRPIKFEIKLVQDKRLDRGPG